MSGDKVGENQSPEKSNSQSQQKRRFTKDGPPSKAELEERARMLDEYKRMREERRRQMFGGKGSKPVNQDQFTSTESISVSTEIIDMITDDQAEAQPVDHIAQALQDPVVEVESIEVADEHNDAETAAETTQVKVEIIEMAEESEIGVLAEEETASTIEEQEQCPIEDDPPMEVDAPVSSIPICTNSDSAVTEAKPLPSWLANWNDFSFWQSDKVYIKYHVKETETVVIKRVPMPHLRLFRLSQVEGLLASGERQLAEAILSVIQAPNQLPCNNPAGKSKRLEKILARLQEFSSMESIEAPPEPSIDLPKPGHFSGSDSEQDEVGSKLQMDVDEASRRHSLILSNCVTPTRKEFRSVQRAASIIMDEEMMGSIKKRLFAEKEPQSEVKSSKIRRVDVDLNQADDDDTGSTVKFAVLTPSKRIQEMLQTDLVISPVRRSNRNLNDDPEPTMSPARQRLYGDIDEIPEMQEIGYLPNPNVSTSATQTPVKKQQPH